MIGRFSALACSDLVHITSFYNGTAYYYVMLKDGAKINIDLVSQTETTEHNGVEVKIAVPSLSDYIEALPMMWYIPNLYVSGNVRSDGYKVSIDEFNSRQTAEYPNFKVGYTTGRYSECCLLLGNVLYKYSPTKISVCYYNHLNILRYINPQFNIGELDVTPNRETLLYSSKTIEVITKKLNNILEFIENKALEDTVNYNTIFDCTALCNRECTIMLGNYNVDVSSLVNSVKTRTYKGKELSLSDSDMNTTGSVITKFLYGSLASIHPVYVILRGELLTPIRIERKDLYNWTYSYRNNDSAGFKIIILPTSKGVKSPVFKSWIKQTYCNNTNNNILILESFCDSINKTALNNFVIEYGLRVLVNGIYNESESQWLALQILKDVRNKAEVIDLVNSADYQAFRTASKSNNPTVATHNINFNITNGRCARQCSFKSASEFNSYYRTYYSNHTLVYSFNGDPLIDLVHLLYPDRDYDLVTVAPKYISLIDAKIPYNWIPVSKLINATNRRFIQVITYLTFKDKIKDYEPLIRMCSELSLFLPKEQQLVIEDINRLNSQARRLKLCSSQEQTNELNRLVEDFRASKLPYDYNVITLLKQFGKIAKHLKPFEGFYNLCGSNLALLAYLMLKQKAIRINNEYYKFIKSKIKNENN